MPPLRSNSRTSGSEGLRRALFAVGVVWVVATFGLLFSHGMKNKADGAATVADVLALVVVGAGAVFLVICVLLLVRRRRGDR